MIETTICLPLLGNPPEKVLLARKQRGFGMGKITGVGGKIETGESAAESAVRELAEEIGITVYPAALHPRGVIDFLFPYKPSWNMRSQLFVLQEWLGNPAESDEVAPDLSIQSNSLRANVGRCPPLVAAGVGGTVDSGKVCVWRGQ